MSLIAVKNKKLQGVRVMLYKELVEVVSNVDIIEEKCEFKF